MKYTLKRPCAKCPFRNDIPPYISAERYVEIVNAGSFICHETVDYSDEGDGQKTDQSQSCAGRMIMLEKMERPDQMMRISERLGLYDATKLDMKAPVYDDLIDLLAELETLQR